MDLRIAMEEIKTKLIYSDLSYRVIGILFEVHNNLGTGYQEKYYQKAISSELKKHGLKFQEQVKCPLFYKDERLGNYFLDFLIEDKLVLEIKKADRFSKRNITQVFAYLKATGLKLGLLANFDRSGVKIKRIVNIL
jgi:GxxExxY protein